MPRWPNNLFDASFFLFYSEEDARTGTPEGGCGFFVHVLWSDCRGAHCYAVTCDHVVPKGKPAYIVATRIGGTEPEIISAHGDLWSRDEVHDLAVLRMDQPIYRAENLMDRRITNLIIKDYSIGAGDEVFAVGRFIDIEGLRANRSLLRSGILASMPEIPIRREGKPHLDSYVVEMRSRSGFSGSPVYVYIPPFSARYEKSPRQVATEKINDPLIKPALFYGPWLLGVHWGELTVRGPAAKNLWARDDIDHERKRIELGSGMIGVVPCRHLSTLLLEDENLKKERTEHEALARGDRMAIEQSAKPRTKVIGEISEEDLNPSHKADFNRLLKQAAQKREREDQT